MTPAFVEIALAKAFGTPIAEDMNNLDFTGTSANTDLEPNEMYLLVATEDCYFILGDSGTPETAADDNGTLLVAGCERWVCTSTDDYNIAVIRVATSGNLNITRMRNRHSAFLIAG